MATLSVRRAVRADLEAILKEAQALNDESAWDLTWNDGAARAYLGAYIAGGDRDILLVMRDGAIAGGALVQVGQECWDEHLAVIDKFFIVRRHRRGTASARLTQAAIDWARARGAAHLFLAAAARFSGVEQGLLIRLMRRHGFNPVGPCLVRPLPRVSRLWSREAIVITQHHALIRSSKSAAALQNGHDLIDEDIKHGRQQRRHKVETIRSGTVDPVFHGVRHLLRCASHDEVSSGASQFTQQLPKCGTLVAHDFENELNPAPSSLVQTGIWKVVR